MRLNGSNLWRNNTPAKGLSNALLAVRTLVNVEPEENGVIYSSEMVSLTLCVAEVTGA